MWKVASERMAKTYYSQFFSRSFLLSGACCLFAFILPILILVSIGYSWNTYAPKSVQPQLIYQNHQINCLLKDGTTTYDSTFIDQITSNSCQAFIGVGGSGNNYAITATLTPTNVAACSFLIYFSVSIGVIILSIAVLPLQIFTRSDSSNIATISQTGRIEVSMRSAIPQSAVTNSQWTSYYSNTTNTLSMSDVHASYNSVKNLSLIPSVASSRQTFASGASSITYNGQFQVPAQDFLSQVSLLQNIRTFVPFYIYLFILLWVILAQPTLRWILQNKIYRSKVSHPKLKFH